jgi:hypothetical protein
MRWLWLTWLDAHVRNSSRISPSTVSTADPAPGRSYFGIVGERNAARTVFRAIPKRFEIALTLICSAR